MNFAMSCECTRYVVNSTTLPKLAPCDFSAASILAKTCRHWASKSSEPTPLPPRSVATCPAVNRNSDAFTRVICEYCPSGLPSASGFWMLISGMMASLRRCGPHPRLGTDRMPPGQRGIERGPSVLLLVLCGVGALSTCYFAAGFAPNLLLFALVHVLIGLGTSATFGPLMADTSQWFTRRRGIAVAIVASGNYIGGRIWA